MLNVMKKGISLQKIHDAAAMAKDAGLRVRGLSLLDTLLKQMRIITKQENC